MQRIQDQQDKTESSETLDGDVVSVDDGFYNDFGDTSISIAFHIIKR